MPAAYWENPDAKDDTPVQRHAADANTYQYPDSRMLDRMPMGKVGSFAIVPAARSDGTSRGFSHDDPGVVHVDPDAPGGGVVVDFSQVSSRDLNVAVSRAQYPHQVYYQLGAPPGQVKQSYDMAPQTQSYRHENNPHLPPGSYVTPSAMQGGGQAATRARSSEMLPLSQLQTQEAMQPQPLPTAHQAPAPMQAAQPQQQMQPQYAPQPQQQPQPQYAVPGQQPQYAPQQYQQPYYPQQPQYAPPPPDQSMQAIQQLTGVVTGLVQAVQQMQNPRPLPAPSGPPRLNTMPMPGGGGQPPGAYPTGTRPPLRQVAEQDDFENPQPIRRAQRQEQEEEQQPQQQAQSRSLLRRQTLRDVEEDNAPRNDGVITGFESLDIPCIVGPIAEKAQRRVVFEYGQGDKASATYHEVVEGDTCIVLVYDSRYEAGTQYMPRPTGENTLTLHVPQVNGKPKKHQVSSLNITYSLGVLDFIVLIKPQVPKEEEEPTEA